MTQVRIDGEICSALPMPPHEGEEDEDDDSLDDETLGETDEAPPFFGPIALLSPPWSPQRATPKFSSLSVAAMLSATDTAMVATRGGFGFISFFRRFFRRSRPFRLSSAEIGPKADDDKDEVEGELPTSSTRRGGHGPS